MSKNESYNGWANYETWNVALWIGNDEGLYRMAKEYRHKANPYKAFVEALKELADDMPGGNVTIHLQTPDGVAWNDSGLDIDALDQMIEEL